MSYLLGHAPCADGEPRGSVLCWSKAFACWKERCSLAGHRAGGPPSAALPCPGAEPCLPSPHSRAPCGPWGSAASDPSPALSACLKTALWTGAALILCTGGWAALLQHPTCSSSPGQLNSPLLFPYVLRSLFPSAWDFSAHFTLCPNTVPLAALGTWA